VIKGEKMVRHFIILWNTVENKEIDAVTTTHQDEWLGYLLDAIRWVYSEGLQELVEIIHVGTELNSKTFRKSEIETIGPHITVCDERRGGER